VDKRSRDDDFGELTLDDVAAMAGSSQDAMEDDPISRAARELLAAQQSPEGVAEKIITADLPARIIAQAFSASQIDIDPRSPLGVADVGDNLEISGETRAISERVGAFEAADPENTSDLDPVAAELAAFDRIFKQSPKLPGIRDSGEATDEGTIAFDNIGRPATPGQSKSRNPGIVHAIGRPGDRHEINDLVYRPDERKPGTGMQLLSAVHVPASNEPASPAPLLQLDPPSTHERNSDEKRSEPESVPAPQEPEPLSMTRPIVLVDLDQSNRFYEAALDEFADRIDGLAQAHAQDALDQFKWELTAEMRALEGFS
jgi:hypothetical protein